MPRDKRPQTMEHSSAISAGVKRHRDMLYGESRPPGGSKTPKGLFRCAQCVRGECRLCFIGTEINGGGICLCRHHALGIKKYAMSREQARRKLGLQRIRRDYQPATNGTM